MTCGNILVRPHIGFKVNILMATKRTIATTTATRKATQYTAPTAPVEVQKEGPPGKPNVGHIVIPYTQGLEEALGRSMVHMVSRHISRAIGL